MNKEYSKNNTGSLWLADKKTKTGEDYYSGTITINNKEYYINMFNNSSDNPKAPLYRLLVNEKKETETAPKEEIKEEPKAEEDPFTQFGQNHEEELNNLELPF